VASAIPDQAVRQIEEAVATKVVGDGDMVVFSSGSTGNPRGIVRRVESWQVSFAPFSDVTGITAKDTVWLPGPLWSSLFLFGALHASAVGAHVLLDGRPSARQRHCTVCHPSFLGCWIEPRLAGCPFCNASWSRGTTAQKR